MTQIVAQFKEVVAQLRHLLLWNVPPADKPAVSGRAEPAVGMAPEVELVGLINRVADFHTFTAEQRREAIEIGLGDLEAALECFRLLASRIPQSRAFLS
jgi:hypothetical protein